MAGIEMGWALPFEGEDVHLLRGVPSFAVEQVLRFTDGSTSFDVASARNNGLEAIDFKPRLRVGDPTGGSYVALGLEVEAATGLIVTDSTPPDPRIDHFYLDIEARITGRDDPDRLTVLVWLHDDIEEVWTTPSPITLPRGRGAARSFRRPTVLARFDDDVIGDVTGHPGVVIQPPPPLEPDGLRTSVAASPSAAIGSTLPFFAILPASLAGRSATGQAVVGPAWEELSAEQRTVESLGFASATAADAAKASANVLLLADGIPDAAEQLGIAQALATSLRRMRPYSWTYDRFILWGLTLASRETGGTLRWLATTHGGVPLTVMAPTEPEATGSWTVENLLHVAGPAVPVPAGGWPALEDQLDNWSVQLAFDGAALAAKIDDETYRSWRTLTEDRVPLNERDTALRIIQGSRTATDSASGARRSAGWRELSLGWGDTAREELNRLLARLLDRTGVPMGDRWTTGEDRRLVVVLSGGHADVANYLPSDELTVMAVEDAGEQPRVTARADGRGIELSGAQWPVGAAATAVWTELRGTFAHELGHALGLGDEYGGAHRLPASELVFVAADANLQAEEGPSGLSDGSALRGERLRWNHLRIARAFLLRDDALAVTEVADDFGDPPREVDGRLAYRLDLEQTGQLSTAVSEGFDLMDGTHPVLFLRTRRLLTDALDAFELSPPLELIRAESFNDNVYVREQVAGAFAPFKALVAGLGDLGHAPILLAPVPKAIEADGFARLLPKLVRDHLTATGRPLDAPSPADQAAWTCPERGNDSSWPKMRNRPRLRKATPFFAARRVPAVWTGGMLYDCGVFHPTSHSIMRGSTSRRPDNDLTPQDVLVPPGDVYFPVTGEPGEFDDVASYLLIDRLDPTRHHELENVIALRDPD